MSSFVFAAAPTLYDIQVEGSVGHPELSIEELMLDVNQEYLFVISNTLPASVELYIGKFGHHIATHYLQGTPSVTQESMNLPTSSKVLWHFVTNTPGEFTFSAVNASTLEKGTTHKIIIQEKVANAKPNVSSQVNEAHNQDKKKERKPKFWLSRVFSQNESSMRRGDGYKDEL